MRRSTPPRQNGSSGPPTAELTRVLHDVGAGRADATDELLPLVYDELRALARGRMAAERPDHTLQATALVHEAFVRLSSREAIAWENRAPFFGAAARAMQRILVEHARARGRRKRGGDRRRVPLDVVDLACDADVEQVVALEEAIGRLAERAPRMAEVVRLRFYAGLSEEETAHALEVSARTVRREWALARAWLIRELEA